VFREWLADRGWSRGAGGDADTSFERVCVVFRSDTGAALYATGKRGSLREAEGVCDSARRRRLVRAETTEDRDLRPRVRPGAEQVRPCPLRRGSLPPARQRGGRARGGSGLRRGRVDLRRNQPRRAGGRVPVPNRSRTEHGGHMRQLRRAMPAGTLGRAPARVRRGLRLRRQAPGSGDDGRRRPRVSLRAGIRVGPSRAPVSG
jgi:hypothetical protein